MDMFNYKGTLVAEQDRGRLSGLLPVFLPDVEEVPTIRWKDTKISQRLWNRIKAFLLWTQQEFHSESQIRLYFNDQRKCWRALAWPQYIGTGLASDEIDEDTYGTDADLKVKVKAQKEILRKLVDPAKGWYEYGTVHHHCNIGAFQSGTDHKDEIGRPGIHITVGHILSETFDLHARFVINKTLYDVVLSDWIEAEDISVPFYGKVPNIWADQCFKKPVPVYRWKPGVYAGYKPGMVVQQDSTTTEDWHKRYTDWYDSEEDDSLVYTRKVPEDTVIRLPKDAEEAPLTYVQELDVEELVKTAQEEVVSVMDMISDTIEDVSEDFLEAFEQDYLLELSTAQKQEIQRRVFAGVIEQVETALWSLKGEYALQHRPRHTPYEPINNRQEEWAVVPVENMP